MKDLTELKLEGKGFDELAAEIEQTYMDIPMGNTRFQIEHFIMNASITPERKFRTVGLEMRTKLQSVNSIRFSLKRLNIDIEELECKIEKETDEFQRRRMEVDLEMKRSELNSFQKTIKDSVEELKIYYAYFKQLPKLTREQFEKAEEEYYKNHLHNQVVGLQGAILSLHQMGYSVNQNGQLVELKKAIGEE